MDDQQTLWDLEAGREGRDVGLDRVASGSWTKAAWLALAWEALLYAVRSRHYLTSEDVWRELDGRGVVCPGDRRLMGPVMLRGLREGVLEPSSWTHAEARTRNAGPMQIFRVVR